MPVERGLVVKLAKLWGVSKGGWPRNLRACRGRARCNKEIIDLEDAICPAIQSIFVDEGFGIGPRCVWVYDTRVPVVKQGHHDIVFGLAAAMGARRGLQ